MRIVIALGGNALLRRGEPLTAANQRRNIKNAAAALAPIARQHNLVITHGNGPQVGLLALQGAAYKSEEAYPLDVLDAETEGMIGYLIEQELSNLLPPSIPCATLLTQIKVDPRDDAFARPTKPIGPVYNQAEAQSLALQRGWRMRRDGEHYRRVVPSPRPKRILELAIINLLSSQGVIVICAGGGGIPTVCREDGSLIGVEAVIDKDLASSLLARQLKAQALLMLTDVDAIYESWDDPRGHAIRRISPRAIRKLQFDAGSMGPKVDAACEFVEKTAGVAGVGQLKDACNILSGKAGTVITQEATETELWE